MLNRIKRWQVDSERRISLALPKYIRKQANLEFSTKFKNGDRDTFSKVYKKFRKPILSYLIRKLRNRDVAEELTQEVFLKTYRFRSSFDPQFEFSTWLWTIARNTLSDWFRKNKQIAVTEEGAFNQIWDLEEVPSLSPNPEVAFIESSDQEALIRMMSALTDLQKRALLMRLIHRLSYEEIANQLNLSLSAVKSVLYRARLTLTTQVSDCERREPQKHFLKDLCYTSQ